MSLTKSQLKQDLKAAFEESVVEGKTAEEILEAFLTKLTDAIYDFVRSGEVEYINGTLKAGQVVVTAAPLVIAKIK